LYIPTYSRLFYNVWFANEITSLRLAIVNSVKPCGPRSSINFAHYMLQTFAYPITNYAMLALPLST